MILIVVISVCILSLVIFVLLLLLLHHHLQSIRAIHCERQRTKTDHLNLFSVKCSCICFRCWMESNCWCWLSSKSIWNIASHVCFFLSLYLTHSIYLFYCRQSEVVFLLDLARAHFIRFNRITQRLSIFQCLLIGAYMSSHSKHISIYWS